MRRLRAYYYAFFCVLALYIASALLIPPDPKTAAKYNLSGLHIRLLVLAVVIPVILIWVAAFYGYIRLKYYSVVIKKSREGTALGYIAQGLGWLAFGLPALSIISSTLNYISRTHSRLAPTSTIVQNYLNLGLYLIAFIAISKGAYRLIEYVKKKPDNTEQNTWVIMHIVLAVVYTYLVINRPLYSEGQKSIYYLPNWLILSTLVIPYLFLWYSGLRSAYRIQFFSKTVKGSLYRKAISNLASGLSFIIISTVVLQFFSTLSARVDRLSLLPLIILIYILLIVIAIGYLLVARSAQKLKLLEEV
jgi:hypothetical protein